MLYVPQPLGQHWRRVELSERHGISCLVDAEDWDWLQAWRWNYGWHRNTRWKYYAKRNEGVERSTVYMAREIMRRAEPHDEGFYADHVVDHIDGQSLHNRRDNLRWLTEGENARHRTARQNIPSLDEIEARLRDEVRASVDVPF